MADVKGPVPPYQEHQPIAMQHQQPLQQASPINQIAPVPVQHQQSYHSNTSQQLYQQSPQPQQQLQQHQQYFQQQVPQPMQQQQIHPNPNMAQVQSGMQPNYADEHKGQQYAVNTVPAGVPQQQVQQLQQPQYQIATPLAGLGPGPAPVDCPSCRVRSLTRIDFESGNTTYAWAAGFCCVIGLGCIPFCMNNLKDVVHYCSHCGCRLATWHRSGHTEVHMHA